MVAEENFPCIRCNQHLPANAFGILRASAIGRRRDCNECRRKSEAEKRRDPRFKLQAKDRNHRWYLKNIDHCYNRTMTRRQTEEGRRESQRSVLKWIASPRGKEFRREQWRKNPLRGKAHRAIRVAKKNGSLVPPTTCQNCGSGGRIEGHHHMGYEEKYWLVVQWLCKACHMKAHGRQWKVRYTNRNEKLGKHV